MYNANVEYHRNGVGGAGYLTIAFDSTPEDAPKRMLAIVLEDCTTNDEGYLLPVDTHIPELLIIDPTEVAGFAFSGGDLNNWRGADYWSRAVMEILHERENARQAERVYR